MLLDFDRIDLLQAQSRDIHLPWWKKSSWKNLSLRIYPCLNILAYICIAHNDSNYVCIVELCCDIVLLLLRAIQIYAKMFKQG